MAVTEQVDAIRAMGADPIRKLVLPRVLACALALPMLTLISDVLGVLGGMLIASTQFSLPPSYEMANMLRGPIPESIRSCGDCSAPADSSTSRLAPNVTLRSPL